MAVPEFDFLAVAFAAADFSVTALVVADFLAVALIGAALAAAALAPVALAPVALAFVSPAVGAESAASSAESVGSSVGLAVRDVGRVPPLFPRWSRTEPGRVGALLRDRELAIGLLPRELRASGGQGRVVA
ncbi:MAG: hypothetical protein ACR2J5_16095 [Geodermatophilaceae bacterium]